ncbi:MAG: hypothetical protein JWP03_2313 [Phycisphaerales bacterium]|nr:hypothetical protein [Phycisphaerales bacterium]
MPVPYQFFSPTDAARVSKLQFTARQVVEGLITGQHKSPHKGFSVEFSEHREYVPGDEIRHLDWRAYARSDRYYVKLYEQETNLRATLVLDTSASMGFGNKIDYARHLAACIAYLLSTQQDLAGLVAVDESIKFEMPAGSSPAHLDRLFRAMEAIEAGSGTDLPNQLHGLSERLPRRSLVIMLSDLWVEPGDLVKALQHLRYRKHQGMMIHLLDPAELNLPYDRMLTFQDLETREKIQVDPSELREVYKKEVEKYLAQIRRACTDSDVEYHTILTNEPYEKALVRLLSRRS